MASKPVLTSVLAQNEKFMNLAEMDQHLVLNKLSPNLSYDKRQKILNDAKFANSPYGTIQNTLVQQGSFGLIDTPEGTTGNRWIDTANNVVGSVGASIGQGAGAFAVGTALSGGNPLVGIGAGILAGGLSGLGNNARSQLDAGDKNIDWKRAGLAGVLEGAASGLGLGAGRLVAGLGKGAGAAMIGARSGASALGLVGDDAVRGALISAARKNAVNTVFKSMAGEGIVEGLSEAGVEYGDQLYTGKRDNGAILEAGLIGALAGAGISGIQRHGNGKNWRSKKNLKSI
jgi:hypothetical protein